MGHLDDTATYLSDTFISGAFTPQSLFSMSSKATGINRGRKRVAKALFKKEKRYNLREKQDDTSEMRVKP